MVMLINNINGSCRSSPASDGSDHRAHGCQWTSSDGSDDCATDSTDRAAFFHIVL